MTDPAVAVIVTKPVDIPRINTYCPITGVGSETFGDPPVIRNKYLVLIVDGIVKLDVIVSYPVLPDSTPVVPESPPPATFTSPFNVNTVLLDPIDIVPPVVCAPPIAISPAPNDAPMTISPFTTFEPIDKAVVVAAYLLVD